MIGNEHQYRVSREQLARLQQARAGYEVSPHADALTQAALLASVDTLIGDVETEIADYERLVAGDIAALTGHELTDIAEILVKARVAAGLSQGELARRLKVSTQAVNRDEAGGYRRASLERLARVAEVLGLQAEITCQLSNAK